MDVASTSPPPTSHPHPQSRSHPSQSSQPAQTSQSRPLHPHTPLSEAATPPPSSSTASSPAPSNIVPLTTTNINQAKRIPAAAVAAAGTLRSTYNPSKTIIGRALGNELHPETLKPAGPVQSTFQRRLSKDGVGMALSDTPLSTAPSSPQM